jgi:hypothetical protein
MVLLNRITKYKIQITLNSAEEYYILIIITLQHVLANPPGHHQIVKQNICFTYIVEKKCVHFLLCNLL